MADNPNPYGYGYGQYPFIPPPMHSMQSQPPSQPTYNHHPPGAVHPSPVGAQPPPFHTNAQSAYDHNATRIPGLGLGGHQLPMPSFPPGVTMPWQAPVPTPQQPPAQPPQANTPLLMQPRPAAEARLAQQQPPKSMPPKKPTPTQQPNQALEEGELSEGEFEDLYEPNSNTAAPPPTSSLQQKNADGRAGTHNSHTLHRNNLMPTASTSRPGAEQDNQQDNLADDEWEPSYQDRERSGSYSPYLSPREVHRRMSFAGKTASGEHNATNPAMSAHPSALRPTPASGPANQTAKDATTVQPSRDLRQQGVAPSALVKEKQQGGSTMSIAEAKKKAQEAILGLVPLKVRYQDYINEGINPDVVKALFTELGLDMSMPKPAGALAKPLKASNPAPAPAVTQATPNGGPRQNSSPTLTKPAISSDTKMKDPKETSDAPKTAEKTAAEERKDKIARKLAAMAAQKTTTAQPSAPAASTSKPLAASEAKPVSAPEAPVLSKPDVPATVRPVPPAPKEVPQTGAEPSTSSTPTNVPKTRAENNALLQQKLAALKKQQAQKAADKAKADAATTQNESINSPAKAIAEPAHPEAQLGSDSTADAPPVGNGHRSPGRQSPSTTQRNGTDKESTPLPSVSALSSQPRPTLNRGVKRPVASDFDSYTPRFDNLKRTRTEDTLIIDVSDDEDVEMDMGSPTDGGPTNPDPFSAPPRSALGTFPPLSDTPGRRQPFSPASNAAATPPSHNIKTDLLHKQIEKTKRQIAEREAKLAAKRAIMNASPKLRLLAQESPQPPNVNDSPRPASGTGSLRRDRIVSYELPRVSASLREKQQELQLIMAQAQKLELEVQAEANEQQRLQAEIELLSSLIVVDTPMIQTMDGTLGDSIVSPAPSAQHGADPTIPSQDPSPTTQTEESENTSKEPVPSQQRDTPIDDNSNNDLNTDEALQTAILQDNAPSSDAEINGEDPPAKEDKPSANDVVSGSSPKDVTIPQEEIGEAQSMVQETVQNAPSEAASDVDQNVPRATNAEVTETDSSSEEFEEPEDPEDPEEPDVSMQSESPEPSLDNDEPFEATVDQFSVSIDTPMDDQPSTEIIDDVAEQANLTQPAENVGSHTLVDTSEEVQDRSFKELLLLTALQTEQNDQVDSPAMDDILSYKSPLSYFRAYRFHPKYSEDVRGGLRSMTFSSKIDPMRPMCPQVLAGEECSNGTACEYQHFDSMVLSDGEIITQLGSADMFVGETRAKFIDGLKKVLAELKTNRARDFDRITQAIVKHRQDFFDDKSKVLALDDSANEVTS
ncbi:hypothetical protein GGR57DRAFT_251216 [Xylariaceae sp. FL1272]|nr:hypothetical protein GGR57DRAFT_251216 [Xylariaceae sp. FL1272]